MAWDKLLGRAVSAPAKESHPEESEASAPHADLNLQGAKRETRRSKRVYISMPVLVKFQRGSLLSEEETATESVNAHGCLLRLSAAPERGQKLTIVNLKSTQEMECRVVYVGQTDGGKTQAGVEFMRAAEYFWHIAFPPDDWNPADRKLPVNEQAVGERSSKRA